MLAIIENTALTDAQAAHEALIVELNVCELELSADPANSKLIAQHVTLSSRIRAAALAIKRQEALTADQIKAAALAELEHHAQETKRLWAAANEATKQANEARAAANILAEQAAALENEARSQSWRKANRADSAAKAGATTAEIQAITDKYR